MSESSVSVQDDPDTQQRQKQELVLQHETDLTKLRFVRYRLPRCNKGRGMCYPVCGMVHIKEPLLLIGKSSLCGGRGFLSHYQNGP